MEMNNDDIEIIYYDALHKILETLDRSGLKYEQSKKDGIIKFSIKKEFMLFPKDEAISMILNNEEL